MNSLTDQSSTPREGRKPSPARSGGKRPKLRALIAAGLVGVLFFCAGAALYVAVLMPEDRLAALLVHGLEAAGGGRYSIASAKAEWMPEGRVRLILNSCTFIDHAENQPLLHIPKASLVIRPTSLLRGIPAVERAVVEDMTAYLSHPADGKDSGSLVQPAENTRGGFMLSPEADNVEIRNARLVVRSNSSGASAAVMVAENVNVKAREVSLEGAGRIEVRGRLPASPTPGEFDAEGEIRTTPWGGSEWSGAGRVEGRRLPADAIAQIARGLGLGFPLSGGFIDARLEVEGASTAFSVKGEIELDRVTPRQGLTLSPDATIPAGLLRFEAERRDGRLAVHLKLARVPGMVVVGRAETPTPLGPRGVFSATVARAEFDLAKIFPLIPVALIRSEDRKRLSGAGLRGKVKVNYGAYYGNLEDLFHGDFSRGRFAVDAYMDGVSGFVPGFRMPVRQASGRVRLDEHTARFEKVRLTLGASPILVSGQVTNLGAGEPLADLSVQLRARAEDLQPLLAARPVARRLPHQIRAIKEPRGRLETNLHLTGKLSYPTVKGKLAVEDFSCRVEGFSPAISEVNGLLTFSKNRLTISGVTGRIGKSVAQAEGFYSPARISVDIESEIRAADLRSLLEIPKSVRIEGAVPVRLSLEGTPDEPRFSTKIDLKKVALEIGWYVRKRAGSAVSIEASGVRTGDEVTLEDAYLVIGGRRIAVKGRGREDGRMKLTINLPPQGIQTEDLIPIMRPEVDLKPGGRFEGDAVIAAGPGWFVKPSIEANLGVNHVSSRIFGFHKPVDGLTGRIRWRGKNFSAVIDRARIGSSLLSGSISAVGWEAPTVDITLDFSFLDNVDFSPPPEYKSSVTWGEWINTNWAVRFLGRAKGVGALTVDKGKTSCRAFSHFSARFEGAGGLIEAPDWQMELAGGALRGSAKFDIREDTEAPVSIEFQGDRLRSERLLCDRSVVNVEGSAFIGGHMQWHTTQKRENDGVYKTGSMEVRLHDGVVHRFEVLSKIFSLLNLGSLVSGRVPDIAAKGLPFERVGWKMEIIDNKWKVNPLRFFSDAARIDAKGMYFAGQGRMDFAVQVAPLVGIDKIFYGLFGDLIARDGKTLTTTFRVRGLVHSPDIRLEPLESFAVN